MIRPRFAVGIPLFLALFTVVLWQSNEFPKGSSQANVADQAAAVMPPTPGIDLELRIEQISRDGKFLISMNNVSKKPIRVFREGNSWGEMNWRIFRLNKGKIETFFESPIQLFTKNTPSFVVIQPGTRIIRDLNINGGNWCGRGYCSWWDEHGLNGKEVTFEEGDTVVISYDVRPSDEAKEWKVWVGVTAATGTVR